MMATHFVCQPTEPLAHRYPIVQKHEKGHGAVSQYEVLNLEDKVHTKFPPPGWDTSQSSEESLPLCRAPAPWDVKGSMIGPDPTLCITPEKSLANPKQRFNKPMYPIPKQHEPEHLIGPDPDLCITPEKHLERIQKSNLKNDNEELSKTKTQHRVRFELENSLSDSDKENFNDIQENTKGPSKTYRPSDYSENENSTIGYSAPSSKSSDGSVRKPKQYTVRQENKQTVYVPLIENEMDKDQKLTSDTVKPKTESAETYKSVLPTVLPEEQNDCKKEIYVKTTKNKQKTILGPSPKEVVIPEAKKDIAAVPKRKVRVTRESKESPFSNDYKFPFSDGGDSVLEYEHVFTRPEYNSTLRMRTELEQIKDSHIDVGKALEKKLKTSEKKQTEIREKAATRVNQSKEEFAGLVSLEIPVDNIRTQAEKEKTAKVKPSKVFRPQVYKDKQEPDLMEFLVPELQKEIAEFSVPGLSTPSETLSTASHSGAFDLYRHNRVWDSTSNFRGGK